MTDDPASLSGKVALVTGGASGIGTGIARVLARRGARVAIGDLDERSASSVAAFLASDLAANITGEALNVSGGQQMH